MAKTSFLHAAVATILLLAAGCARPGGDEPAAIVVVAGQSNALGYGLTAADLPPSLATPDPDVRIWDGARFQPMAAGRNTGFGPQPGAWGPEAGFARAWRAAHPDAPLHVVKFARGSTPLAASPGRDWSPGTQELFAAATTEIEEAKAALAVNGGPARVVAILWVQGEADAVDPAKAAAYGPNLAGLIQAIRRDWSSEAPIVVGQTGPGLPYAKAVRAGQAAVASPEGRVAVVDTGPLPRQADGLHIAADGQARLGAAMAEAAQRLSR